MTHDEAHKAAEEKAARVGTECNNNPLGQFDDLPLRFRAALRENTEAQITAYLAAMEAAGFVVVKVPPQIKGVTQYAIGWNECRAAMLAARPKVTP